MILRLLQFLVVAVMFDGIIMILRFQAPGALDAVIHFWREGVLLLLLLLCGMCVLRAGRAQVAAPRGLIAAWLLIMGLGFIGYLVGQARGTAEPVQAVRALRLHYMYPLLFGLLVLPARPLPALVETRLFHALGVASMLIVAAGCTQAMWPAAWETHAWVRRAVEEGSVDIRTIEGVFRPFATFTAPFSFGHFCALMCVMSLAYVLFHRRASRFYWLVFLATGAGVVVSTIRAAILGAFAGVAYLVMVRMKILSGPGFRAAVAGALIVVCMGGPFLLAARDDTGAARTTEGAYMAKGSLDARLDFWGRAWSRLKSPADFVFGLGTGAVGGGKQGTGDRSGDFEYNPIDNYYLLVLVNHGLLGVLVWGAFILQLFLLAVRASVVRAEADWFLNGFLAVLVMDLGASLFRMLLATPPEAVTFWVIAGLAAVRAHGILCGRTPDQPQCVRRGVA